MNVVMDFGLISTGGSCIRDADLYRGKPEARSWRIATDFKAVADTSPELFVLSRIRLFPPDGQKGLRHQRPQVYESAKPKNHGRGGQPIYLLTTSYPDLLFFGVGVVTTL